MKKNGIIHHYLSESGIKVQRPINAVRWVEPKYAKTSPPNPDAIKRHRRRMARRDRWEPVWDALIVGTMAFLISLLWLIY